MRTVTLVSPVELLNLAMTDTYTYEQAEWDAFDAGIYPEGYKVHLDASDAENTKLSPQLREAIRKFLADNNLQEFFLDENED